MRRLIAVATLVLAWQAVSDVVLPRIAPYLVTLLPSPLAVAGAFLDLTAGAVILGHVLASLERVLIGFGLATVLGVWLGVAIAWWPRFGRLVDPLVELLRPIPPLAWIPLAILWFGIGDTQNVFIIFLGAFFPVVVNSVAAVRRVDRTLVWGALTLGGTRGQILRDIVLPGALPTILTGLRIGLGVGWMSLVAAELVAASSGLGFLIEDSRNLLFTERVLVGMVLIGLLGLVMDRGMRRLHARLVPWARAWR